MQTLSRGILISVEGIDGSGKTTLIEAIANQLRQQQLPVIVTKEPGGTALGKQLRSILQEQKVPLNPKSEFLLFAADRAQHFHELIIPHLQANSIIISDRMADSSLVYQGFGRGLDIETIKMVNAWAMHGLQPDITLYVRIAPEIAHQRLAQRKNLSAYDKEKETFVHKLVHGFDTIFNERNNVIRLDGEQDKDALCAQAMKGIMEWFDNHNILSDSSDNKEDKQDIKSVRPELVEGNEPLKYPSSVRPE